MNTRHQGKSSPLPAEWFSDSDDSEYKNINTPESDPEFFLNYTESEEKGWSTETNSDSEGESSELESENSESESEYSEEDSN